MISCKIDHISFATKNIEHTKQFWLDHFNATLLETFTYNDRLFHLLDLDGYTIELTQAKPEDPFVPTTAPSAYGFWHIAITVTDIQTQLATLAKNGVKIIKSTRHILNRFKIAFVQGPDDILIELIEHTND